MTTALECIDDVIAKISNVPQINGKAFFVYTQEDLMNQSGKIVYPAVGVIYEGLRSRPDENTPNSKMGLSSDLFCSILLLVAGTSFGNVDYKKEALTLIDTIRGTLLKTRSPAGHYWNFLVESPVIDINGAFGYYLRFNTPIMLA